MVPFYGWGSTASRLALFRGGSLLFTTKFPEISSTHFINPRRIKGWANLGAIQWFWTQDPWIVNPVPWPLCHYSIFTENSLIFQNHSGFKPGDSCTNQLLSIMHQIYKSFDDGHEVLQSKAKWHIRQPFKYSHWFLET